MSGEEVGRLLEANPGKAVTLTYNGHTQTVTVLAIDQDGLLCRAIANEPGQHVTEFWLAFRDVLDIHLAHSPEA